jgi:3-oxoacyl-[acyl-carrier-protein] synthase II
MGAVCSAGASCETFGESVVRGTPSFSPIDRPHLAHFRATHAGIIRDFDGRKFVADPLVRSLDRFVHLSAAAAGEAIGSAGIAPRELSYRMGLVCATCSGPMQTIERRYARILSGDESLTKEELFATRYYCGAKALAFLFGISGLSTTVVTACSASTAALGFAADLIRFGILDVALAGGSDTFSETTLAGFDGLKATCEGTCAPFSRPVGLNLGEGAAFCVLESQPHAESRRATVHAEIMGFGLSNDAYHCTAPDPSGTGQSLAMERALRDAGVSPSSIFYINAHGTGTEANDKAETKAIRKVFGGHTSSLPVSSIKSIIGHCLGAAGALETVGSILSLGKGFVPPTAHFSERRDGCVLDYVPDAGRRAERSGPMLKNNFAFGGNNASIVVRVSPDPSYRPPETGSNGCVVITGIGVVSPAGIGADRLCEAASGSKDVMREVTLGPALRVRAGMVPAFDMASIDRRLDIRNMDASSIFALAATRLALAQARGERAHTGCGDIGLFLSLSAGPSWAETEHISSLLRGNFRINRVAAFPYIVPNSVAGNVCKALRLAGHNTTLSFGPGAGLMGLGVAHCAIKNGHAKSLVSVSADELSKRILLDLHSAGLLSAGATPFAEGACAMMLETESNAALRGATVLGTVCSAAYSTDIGDCILADAEARPLEDTIRSALDQAGIGVRDIGMVCRNAASAREAAAMDAVLEKRDEFALDLSSRIGFAEATGPLFTLSFALLNSSLETGEGNKYILVVFSSPHGINCATIIQKGDPKERSHGQYNTGGHR